MLSIAEQGNASEGLRGCYVPEAQTALWYTNVMSYDELITVLIRSSKEDWEISDDVGISTFKPDLNVTIRLVNEDEPVPFKGEDWALNFPDKKAYVVMFDLYYGSSFVKRYYLASVDGHRARLPYPKSAEKLTITHEQYSVGQAVDVSGQFVEYLKRAEFSVL